MIEGPELKLLEDYEAEGLLYGENRAKKKLEEVKWFKRGAVKVGEIEKLSELIIKYLKDVGLSTEEVEKEIPNAVRWAYAKMTEEEAKYKEKSKEVL